MDYDEKQGVVFISEKELDLIEKLLLDYINNIYFLGQHQDLEIRCKGYTLDLAINIDLSDGWSEKLA